MSISSVYPPIGKVRISAPLRMKLETIRVFAISKLGCALQRRLGFELDTAAISRLFAVIRILPNGFTDPFSAAIKRVRSLVGELDPERPPENLFKLAGFRDLVDLGLIVRTISRNHVATSFGEVIDAANLLARGNAPTITISHESRAVTFTEREGLLLAMVNCITDAISEQCQGDMSIDARVITSGSSAWLRFTGRSHHGRDWNVVVSILQRRLFWRFLACEMPLTSVAVDVQGFSISIARIPRDAEESWVEKAFQSFYGARQLLSAEQSEVLAGMLHDLKNLISAFAVATSGTPTDRTARLKALFDASRHLDGATAIAESLSALAGLSYKPSPSPINPAEWLRGYIAKNLTRVPAAVRIEPPRNTAVETISVVATYLEAILDNLVKNALEAMAGNGQLSFEWVVVDGPRTLVIEFCDSGPGMSPEQVAEIRSGGNVATTKRQGSGLGIASIRSMLQRVEGGCEVSSRVGGGTHWTVLMPELDDEQVPEGSRSEEQLEGSQRGLRA